MILTTVQVQRPEGTVIARGLAVQIDQATEEEKIDEDGARPYDQFMLYTTVWPATALRRRDVLVDEVNVDPETSALAKYRVVGQPETFATVYQSALVERVVGS